MNSIVSIAFVLVIAVASSNGYYCNIGSCRQKGAHTMCAYADGLSPRCGRHVVRRGVSDIDKTEILATHNNMRAWIASGQEWRGAPGPQPPAKHMSRLEWDDQLAAIAQRWADQCDFRHDSCRDVPQYQVGQNLGERSIKGARNNFSLSSIIQMWFDEVDKFDGRTVSTGITMSNFKAVGHYTQLVWGNTNRIGCGRVTYFDHDGWEKLYLVCNYGPTGNWLNSPVYAT